MPPLEGAVIDWGCDVLASNDPLASDPVICEIAGLNPADRYERERCAELLSRLVATRGFVVQSAAGQALGQAALRRMCERYVSGEIAPYDLCRLVSPIEQIFDFPDWLGNLFNAGDWIDPETRREDVPHLSDEAAAVLAALRTDRDHEAN